MSLIRQWGEGDGKVLNFKFFSAAGLVETIMRLSIQLLSDLPHFMFLDSSILLLSFLCSLRGNAMVK